MNGEMDEIERVRLAQMGDQAAYSALADHYWEPLRRWLHGLSSRADVADDITQEALLRAWTDLKNLKNVAKFRAWLFRIARNLLRDRYRDVRERNRERRELDLPDAGLGPLDELIEREGYRELTSAIGKLPCHYREAYLLWTQNDWPYHDIALVLKVTEETARWRVCVARQLLVSELKAFLKP